MGLKIRALCDLSGRLIEDEVGDETVDPEELIPDGWLRIDIARPIASAQNAATLVAKGNLVEGMVAEQRRAGTPENVIAAQYPVIAKTADATFAALESITPVRDLARVSILIADPDDKDTHPQVVEILHQLAAVLGQPDLLRRLGVQTVPRPVLVPSPPPEPAPPPSGPALVPPAAN